MGEIGFVLEETFLCNRFVWSKMQVFELGSFGNFRFFESVTEVLLAAIECNKLQRGATERALNWPQKNKLDRTVGKGRTGRGGAGLRLRLRLRG